MTQLLLTLFEISAATGAVVLLVVLLSPLIDRAYHAKWKYWLWLLLAVRLLIPWNPSFDSAPLRVAVEIPAVVLIRPEQPSAPSVPPDPEQAPAVLPSAPVFGSAGAGLSLPELGTMVWLAGAAGVFAWNAAASLRFSRRLKRWSLPVVPNSAPWTLCRQLEGKMGLSRQVSLRVCSLVSSPMMVGLFRPVLILPRVDYPMEELTLILRHELTHSVRRDLWYKLLLLLVKGVHWFNPAVWLLAREANRDLEISCDALVMAGATLEERRRYGHAILSCLHREMKGQPALSTHFYGGKRTLKERLSHILSTQKRRRGIVAFCLLLIGALLAGGLVACTLGAEPPALDGPEVSGSVPDEEEKKPTDIQAELQPAPQTPDLSALLKQDPLTLTAENFTLLRAQLPFEGIRWHTPDYTGFDMDETQEALSRYLTQLGLYGQDFDSLEQRDEIYPDRTLASLLSSVQSYDRTDSDQLMELLTPFSLSTVSSVEAVFGFPMEEDAFWLREHVEQAARLLYGPDYTVTHQNANGFVWCEKEGVYTPPHRGGTPIQQAFVLRYEETAGQITAEMALLYPVAAFDTDESDPDKVTNVRTRFVVPESLGETILEQAEAPAYLEHHSHRYKIVADRTPEGGFLIRSCKQMPVG